MKINALKQMHKSFHEAAHGDRKTAIENCNKVLEKTATLEPAVMGPVHAFLKSEIARHSTMLDHHANAIEACEKTLTSDLEKSGDGEIEWLAKLIDSRVAEAIGNTVAPPLISKVAPTAPGVTLVPRPGGSSPEKSAVPLEFQKLVAIDDDEG